MTELEKLRKGEYYRMNDTEIDNIQTRAITLCQQFNSLSITEKKERENLLRELLGSVGNNPQLKPGFLCDTGSNIHIGDNFITNYNVTILIAEDEESNFLLLKTILKRHCNVLQARTGLELLKVFAEKGADLILLDIKMPEMNGIEALKEIRKKDTNIPIIMQSAYAFENDMEAARAAGSNGFITKPINIVELKKTISKFLPQIIW